MSRFNNWKENIMMIKNQNVYTEFVRNVFNELGNISPYTVLNHDLVCTIDVQKLDQEIIDQIMKFRGIKSEKFNKTIIYKNHNALDFLSAIYDGADARYRNENLYRIYLEWLFNKKGMNNIPVCKFTKTSPLAVIPSKVRVSDVGFDLTAISKVKDVNSNTVMLDTGIIISPQLGYYAKIYPRSSLVKSGYMLTNSVGIIDATFRDSLKICLVKVNDEAPEITFPFKCCQLIFEQQIPFMMEEVTPEEIDTTTRDVGGFGSTDKK